MKNSIKLFMASCCALIASNALAADGTIDIKGKVISDSCSISVNGRGSDATINLPDVSVNALASAGAVAGNKNIYFELSGCPKDVLITSYFEPVNVDPNTGYLTNNAAAPAGNVQVQVLNRGGDVIDLRNNGKNYEELDYIADDAGNLTLQYSTQYVAVGAAATAGDVATQLVYTLKYH